MKLNIFIVGVGGQGTLTASKIIGQSFLREGYNVIVGEIHGMAQRGGIVESTVVVGPNPNPMIADGDSDIFLGFEPLETYRALRKVSKKTTIFLNPDPIIPFTVNVGQGKYPDVNMMIEKMRELAGNLIIIKANELAKKAGSLLASNTVMLGALAESKLTPLNPQTFLDVIIESVPRFKDVNIRAFNLGREAFHKKVNTV